MVKPNLKVKIGGLELKNPVLVASGTFGSGEEYGKLVDLNKLGAIVTKSVTLNPREGNVPPRVVETPSGMLNSIGLQNDGIDAFIKDKLPFLNKVKTAVIVSIAAHRVEDYAAIAGKFDKTKRIDAIEINISCPNVKGGLEFAREPGSTAAVVGAVRRASRKPVIAKLSPNVKDITEIAMAAEDAGADAVSLVNTFTGMAIDIDTKRPVLGNIIGGLSGPAIKPVALRMVWETAKKVKIPVIGIGGIMNYEDAVEFIIAGASAVQVGTANFVNPKAAADIVRGIEEYMRQEKVKNIKELTGCLRA
ncbi:MAG: dihydroorotate dehydrogenase [Candidatus Omnitrophica bacterium]|nr:dihydroorotate dehydrogenase [Candidatus Omnitrophota bacterium]MDD5310220.1 dihydroorotate dehydrogenase [Candidatus Omnitrophota bacterium]MDD5546202.1 dihydroorotate dehydrogenase [Candidatus Omnitrophota bacterium]